tara:strand:+ start:3135 stop:3266 length:132 start_codon:yes stop_codon:yes gene_type:complete
MDALYLSLSLPHPEEELKLYEEWLQQQLDDECEEERVIIIDMT